ncbi:MAG: insulinase family protein [Cellulosilyticaceae bacterium]
MTKLQINTCYHGFKLIEETYIEEVKAMGRVFKHQKSGAHFIHLDTKDDHKAFSITFKTLPKDNTGVLHIIEHAVCCASEKFPLKDTFVEIDKGSLNTGLNACTYKDMTMYYCSTRHSKDLQNLVTVLSDLVFKPLIYTRPYIFKQEGWHYALEDEKDDITYNGIVYNEMQGEYSDASAYLEYAIHTELFKDTPYQYDSGGLPQEIINLTEETFLQTHKDYYKPSNCIVYLYGDEGVLEYLKFFNENYFNVEQEEENLVAVPYQKAFKEPKRAERQYPVEEDSEGGEGNILNMTFVVGEAKDTKQRLAFQILEHMLLKSAASPLLKMLIEDKKMGKLLEESGYDCGKLQPTFSITLRDATEQAKDMFEQTIFDVLEKLVTEGIDTDLLEAAIHTVTFAMHEGQSAAEAMGIIYCEEILQSYCYGGDTFSHLKYECYFQEINEGKNKGYFEQLIKHYFLENPHRLYLIMVPDKKISKIRSMQMQENLKAYKESLSDVEISKLIAVNQILDEVQEAPNPEENLAILPTLTKEDIVSELQPIQYSEEQLQKAKLVYSHAMTQEIIYMHLVFDTKNVKQEDISYLGLLSNLLTYVSTKNETYDVLENKINCLTGGLNCSMNAYASCEDTNQYNPLFRISLKYLADNTDKVIPLLTSICKDTIFDEYDKIKEIIGYIHYEMERSFKGAPEYRAMRRIYTYFSEAAVYEDLTSGMAYYQFIHELYHNFDKHFEEVSSRLKVVYKQVMTQNNLTVSILTEEKYHKTISLALSHLVNALPVQEAEKVSYKFVLNPKNEAYSIGGNVQAVAMGGNFKAYGHSFKGALNVANNLLESTYLWDKIRLQGGAYGCNLSVSRDGNMLLCSYCDPNLKETLDVYCGIGKFLRKVNISEKELLKYIIGTVGGLDYPLTMEQQSERNLTYYVCGVTFEMLQKERAEVLGTTLKDLHEMGKIFDVLKKAKTYCVIGSQSKIRQHEKLFSHIHML